jgi:hypothetical protein
VAVILAGAAVTQWSIRIKSVNIFKMGRRGIQASPVDADMPVFADGDSFAGQADQTFDVELVLLMNSLDALGLEHNNIAALRVAEIISESVN